MGTEQRIAILILLTFHIDSQCLFHRCLCKFRNCSWPDSSEKQKVGIRAKSEKESANERKKERGKDTEKRGPE